MGDPTLFYLMCLLTAFALFGGIFWPAIELKLYYPEVLSRFLPPFNLYFLFMDQQLAS